jgi:UDP-GlcNAc3NAcA epimerase
MKIATIVGARPQFIKAAAVSQAIRLHNEVADSSEGLMDEVLIHTGQHYDHGMSGIFFETLGLAEPKHNLGVGSGSHSAQLAKMLERLERVLEQEQPDVVLVYGDTNSTLAGAMVADCMEIPVAHVEAGLRSFNRRMPEERNRVLTDHVSSLLFVPTETAIKNLEREGIVENVFLVGDVMQEAAMQHGERAGRKSAILDRLGLVSKRYALATVHRAENTNEPGRLHNIVKTLMRIGASQPVVWPVHPRTRQRLSPEDVNMILGSGVKLTDPVSYPDMLLLERQARVILTDSGGVQKEAMWFQVPCITLREETEWVETVESGWNQIAGSDPARILRAFGKALQTTKREDVDQAPKHSASNLIVDRLRLFAGQRMRRDAVTV